MQERGPGIQEPNNPLPLDVLVPRVNQHMKKVLEPQKLEQAARLTGTAPERGASYDPKEGFPDPLALKPPAPPDGKAAGVAQIQSILDEINTIPPVRMSVPSGDATLRIANLPIFSAKDLEGYKADYHTKRELDEMIKINPDKYVLRQAVLDAAQALRDNAKFTMEESLTSSGGPISPALKKQFLQKQKEPGLAIFELERALGKLQDAGKERDKEPSKRWHAHYDYALARLMGRLVYTYEYNYILAEVRGDRLPELDPKIHNGWRVASRQRISINESKVKDMAKTIGRTWKRIAEEHAGTPWAIMAKRESLTALGLEWKPSRE